MSWCLVLARWLRCVPSGRNTVVTIIVQRQLKWWYYIGRHSKAITDQKTTNCRSRSNFKVKYTDHLNVYKQMYEKKMIKISTIVCGTEIDYYDFYIMIIGPLLCR